MAIDGVQMGLVLDVSPDAALRSLLPYCSGCDVMGGLTGIWENEAAAASASASFAAQSLQACGSAWRPPRQPCSTTRTLGRCHLRARFPLSPQVRACRVSPLLAAAVEGMIGTRACRRPATRRSSIQWAAAGVGLRYTTCTLCTCVCETTLAGAAGSLQRMAHQSRAVTP